jgi:hypothetical protein
MAGYSSPYHSNLRLANRAFLEIVIRTHCDRPSHMKNLASPIREGSMNDDDANRAHSELLARLSNLIDDIRTLKTQQWQTTYYSLLLSGHSR